MSQPYTYKYRPVYRSTDMLLEFNNDDDVFLATLFNTLKPLQPIMPATQVPWAIDEICYSVDSNMGQFLLNINNWGLTFIIGENNQACISAIEELLSKSEDFRKEEVDFDAYN